MRESLVKTGAFDGLVDRRELLGDLLNAADLELISMENEALDVCLSGHLLDEFWYDDGVIRINETMEMSQESEFVTIGIVDRVYECWDERGEIMAFVAVEDNTGAMDVVIFASVYDCPLDAGDIIYLEGRLDHDDPPKAIAVDYDLVWSRDPD